MNTLSQSHQDNVDKWLPPCIYACTGFQKRAERQGLGDPGRPHPGLCLGTGLFSKNQHIKDTFKSTMTLKWDEDPVNLCQRMHGRVESRKNLRWP